MKSINRVLAGAAVTAALGGGLLFAASPASAAAPSWEPDANGNGGTIAFYDASGNQVTSGSNLSHLFEYAVASTPEDPASAFHKASLSFAFPNHLQPTSGWFVTGATVATTYPITTGPSSITSLPATTPVSHPGATEMNLTAALGSGSLDTTAGYDKIMQIRMTQSGGFGGAYWTADIQFDTAAGTWTQVYGSSLSTTTTLTASPDPSTFGNTVTLTATITPSAAAGTVQFKDGATNIGTPVTVASGTAVKTTNTLATGAHSLSAVFTPTDPATYGPSTGTFSTTVNPPATATTTSLGVSGGYLTAGSAASLSATVSPSSAPGSVAFYDGATLIPGTVTNPSAGQYQLDLPGGFTAGGHSIVAKFTPTDLTQFAVSQSAPQAFLTQAPQADFCTVAGSVCTDQQNITATVPVGTLVINTPYTSDAPLDLGTFTLSSDSSTLTAAATFAGITVTDTRSGSLPWTVQAIASDLSDGSGHANGVINAQNLGLTSVAETSHGAGFIGPVSYFANVAANGLAPGAAGSAGLGGVTPHDVAHAVQGLGTITMHGTLTLIAPSSTEPATYAGTITFTVG
jgi:hypothetical protein